MMKYRGIPAGYEDDDPNDSIDSIERTTQNLKITIVPDIRIGSALNGEDFDCELNADQDNWFDAYREMWNAYKRTPSAQQSLKIAFMKDPEPLLFALKLFASCPGCNNLKNKNLALFILETVCDLYKQHPGIAATCDDNTRMIAFNFVKTCGIVTLYKAVMETYELRKIRDLLVPKIRQLISQGHFKDAAYWAMHLEVTSVFSIFDIVFPLILQDKVFLAEEYLNVAKEQQLPTLQYLDSLLDKQKTVFQHCDEILAKYKYTDIKHNVLSYRPMSKLVMRLAKKYKVEAHLTPNLNFTKACSYMHYLYRKYQDGGMSCESWRELVRDTATTKALQLDLVLKIASYGDLEEAIYWARHFKVPIADCPSTVQAKLERGYDVADSGVAAPPPVNAASAPPDTVDGPCVQAGCFSGGGGAAAVAPAAAAKFRNSNSYCTSEFLTLQLPADCIIVVDAKKKFLEMLACLEGQLVIAFDSEWKPSVCNDNVVSLLQLATFERVYLLDCLAPQLTEDLWRLLGRKIFNNLEILKIGFSLNQDLRMLQKSLPLQLNLQSSACYLDLRELWRRLKYMQIVTFPFGRAVYAGESLSALTAVCLGKKLDKSNQCSNWANRPLRYDQIVYAALDAHCLLQIYQVLAELLQRMGMDIDQVVDEITTANSGYLFRMKRATSGQNETDQAGVVVSHVQRGPTATRRREMDIIGATDISFICDGMLFGLAKELRKLGIDCIDINKLDVNFYIDLAKREQRFVLSRDARYMLFSNELPQKQCIEVPTDSSVDQVLNIINYLNIEVLERNLFTRCLQCNGNEFILALQDEMQLMRFGQVQDRNESSSRRSAKTANPYEKTFKLLNVNEHIMSTKTTYRGKPIKLNRIKPHLLRTKEHFYICDNCGVCTWDGAHPLPSSIMNVITSGTLGPAGSLTSNASQ